MKSATGLATAGSATADFAAPLENAAALAAVLALRLADFADWAKMHGDVQGRT